MEAYIEDIRISRNKDAKADTALVNAEWAEEWGERGGFVAKSVKCSVCHRWTPQPMPEDSDGASAYCDFCNIGLASN